jgi:peptidoglycan/xylan/chitin deacetylase (PgdA/CDA1 family)
MATIAAMNTPLSLRDMKDAVRNFSATIYCRSGMNRVRHRGTAVILVYHRVLRPTDLEEIFIQAGMYVLDDVFDMQMRFLKDAFEVVPLMDLLARWRTGARDLRRYCTITFDDGWLDNYVSAYPILRQYGMPATIFLPTAFIGTPARFWWDELACLLRSCWLTRQENQRSDVLAQISRPYPWLAELAQNPTEERLDRAVEKFKNVPEQQIHEWFDTSWRTLDMRACPQQRVLLNWQEVEEMSAAGISFGSHSCTHRILTRLTRQELRKELRDSRDSLCQRPIRSIPVFCYPNGDYNVNVVEEVRQAGYEAAVSGRFGLERGIPDDLWRLKRIGVHNDVSTTPALFALRMAGLAWA